MPAKQKIPTFLKIVAALLTPLLTTVIALYIYGMNISNAEQIYDNISIDGVDVSGLTRSDAMLALPTPIYEERINNAKVSIIFPDKSKLMITGSDVGLKHNARDVVAQAYSVGRGVDVISDVISYIRRIDADEISFNIDFELSEELLKNKVALFVENYNEKLTNSTPAIKFNRVLFTKGAGRVTADIDIINDLAYIGLFESFEEGHPVEIIISLPEVRNYIHEIVEVHRNVFVPVVSSDYDRESNSATESTLGITFDMTDAVERVSDLKTGETATFMLIFTSPEYSQEYLQSLLFRDLIGKRTTYAHGSSNRLNNIDLASQAINGQILLPGEEFSFNETVGERTAARGFMMAPILIQGETGQSIGGGICQVSSTIYAGIRPSELLVTEQRRHGKPVPYLPWGWDATVFWNFIDFKFVNNTDYPLRIDVELDGRNVNAQVWGTIKDDFPRAADWNK